MLGYVLVSPGATSAEACYPDGHLWDYYTDTLSFIQVTATHLKIGCQ